MNNTLADTIVTGMNNPECSFWVGMSIGQMMNGRLLIYAFVIYFLFRLVDKFVYTPSANFIFNKIKKKFFKK